MLPFFINWRADLKNVESKMFQTFLKANCKQVNCTFNCCNSPINTLTGHKMLELQLKRTQKQNSFWKPVKVTSQTGF